MSNIVQDEVSNENPDGFLFLLLIGVAIFIDVISLFSNNHVITVLAVIGIPFILLLCFGLTSIEPGDALVLTFFGSYVKTIKESGFYFVNPLYGRQRVSIKQHNKITEILKINDASGNPIEVGANITFFISDASRSIFGVDNVNSFIKNQAEASLRQVVSKYHYDSEDADEVTLRAHSEEVSKEIKDTLTLDLKSAGVTIISAKISHLAYAQEIAASMLRRQQAEAVVAARKKIVEGAVSMVEMAISDLEKKDIVKFNDEQRTHLVSNLMTVLVSEERTQPTLNLGSQQK